MGAAWDEMVVAGGGNGTEGRVSMESSDAVVMIPVCLVRWLHHRLDPQPSYMLATVATSRWSTLCWTPELTCRPWMRWAVMSVIGAPLGGTIGAADRYGESCGFANA